MRLLGPYDYTYKTTFSVFFCFTVSYYSWSALEFVSTKAAVATDNSHQMKKTFSLTIRLQQSHDSYSINGRKSLGYIRYVCAILFCDKRTPKFNEITLLKTPSSWDEMPSIMK